MKKLFFIFLVLLFSSSIYSQDTSREFLDQGVNQITRKNYTKAIELFDKGIELDNGDPELYAHRGQAKHYLTRYHEAILDYNMAIKIEPDYSEVYHLRGLAKAELKDMNGACEDWEISYEKGEKRVMELLVEFCKDYLDGDTSNKPKK
ncbi:MAG: tetratricopeptide repeat protein [Bacteroidales bacterium]|nr:tetratricopeptide repeat protein [Bacteroidales bacterium]MDY0215520.1 tetratricopeptide repeat protein [Bacteroidales bacterium]